MKIHIIDVEEKPIKESNVRVNCGKQLKFYPVYEKFRDTKTCQECLKKHLKAHTKYTYCIKSF